MTRNGDSPRRPDRLGRRDVLSLAGAIGLGSLAGCLNQLPGSGPETIDGDALAELVEGGTPSVPEALPLDIESAFVDEQRAAAESKLGDVPAPFDREEIPNGVIRERLNGTYESAVDSIDRIGEARTPYSRLERATHARVDAHEVQAAWRAIAEDLTQSALRAEVSAIEDSIDETAARWSYVGDDPVRALVVHDEIGGEIRAARNWVSPDSRPTAQRDDNALAVGGLAADHERARTSVAVAAYLFERFRKSLETSADQRERFESTDGDLRGRIRDRSDSLPAEDVDDPTSLVDRDIDETAGIHALASLGSDARYRANNVTDADESGPYLASNILSAADALVHIRAFDSLRERIEDGDDVAVESAEDVAALRSAAIEAIEETRAADRAQTLVRTLLPRYADGLRWTDDRFERSSESVPVDSVAWDAAEYVFVAETCRAVPAVSADVASALRGERDA